MIIGGSTPAVYKIAKQTADNITNNTTVLANCTGLAFDIAAGAKYGFEIIALVNSGSEDLKLAIDTPAAPTLAVISHVGKNAAGTVVDESATGDGATLLIMGSSGALAYRTVRLDGYIVNGATAGTLQVQSAQNAAAAVDTAVLAGSIIRYWEI